MRTVRQSVFETNSSSTHSITINEKSVLMDSITPNQDGVIVLNGGEFGWTFDKFDDPLTKANYCAIDVKNDPDKTQMLKDVLTEQTGAEIVIKISDDYDDINHSYIDHQSEGTSNLAFESKEKLKNFIFNRKSILFTGNDNSSPPPNFYNSQEEVNNMTHYLQLEGTKQPYYLNASDIENKEKIREIINNLYEENINNKYYSERMTGISFGSREGFEMLWGSDDGINYIDQTVKLVKQIPQYDKKQAFKGYKILEEKFIKFNINKK